MSYPPGPFAVDAPPSERWTELYDELAELCGQRNAIDGRIADLVAEMDHSLIGITGCRSVAAWVAWRTGCSPANAATIATVASRVEEFPQCAEALREGRLSLDQVGVIADRGGDGSDGHYVEVATVSTVAPLRTAIKLEPRPDPTPKPEPRRSVSKTTGGPGGEYTTWKITLPKLDAARLQAALDSHREALIAEWTRARDTHAGQEDPYAGADPLTGRMADLPVPMPTTANHWPAPQPSPTGGATLHMPNRRTRRLVVVSPLPTTTTTKHQLTGCRPYETCFATGLFGRAMRSGRFYRFTRTGTFFQPITFVMCTRSQRSTSTS
jgi:hypothetical protein